MSNPVDVLRIGHSIHISDDMTKARRLYISALGGLVFSESYSADEDREMNLLYVADQMIELMEPGGNDNSKPVGRHFQQYGSSYQALHFVLPEEDVDRAKKNLEDLKIAVVETVYPGMTGPGFFNVHPKYSGGINIECTFLPGMPMPADPADLPTWNPNWAVGMTSSIERLSSINVGVRDLEQPRRMMTEAFAGKVIFEDEVDVPEPMSRCAVRVADKVIILCAPKGTDAGPVSQFIAARKGGIYSHTWKVGSLDTMRTHLEGRGGGVNVVDNIAITGAYTIDPDDMLGVCHEFIEKEPWA